ncbi:MAG: zinc-dependent metalloprotease [Verrucomicrobiales bacterium]|nr:zinc-dependent metalloprotease [Verrucomicrobiales bacterium]
MRFPTRLDWLRVVATAAFLLPAVPGVLSGADAAEGDPKPDFPPHTEVLKDFEQVVSSIDRAPSLLQIWVRRKDNQMLAVFPEKFAEKKFFIALTVASGERYAGLQAGDMYVYWRRVDKRMVLVAPQLDVRSTGEAESRASVQRLFTDRVIVDVPILALVPGQGPVIDMDGLLVGEAAKFFGGMVGSAKTQLATIKTAKAFPGNVELAFELPMANGILKSLHYSISEITPNPAYRTRLADERVGYFTTSFSDLGKYQAEEDQVRYVNRWHLEKADPNIKVSPPKTPITFYVESTTPIRYRRWVREGVLMWNKAFEKVGFANAIEVYYQDAATGTHMEKDPEDVRYNFVRWLNNNVGTAIGPSRVDPLTGQILDADIILTDGWIRHYWRQFNEVIPTLALEGMSPSTLAWLQQRPQWDPRVRLAPPSNRGAVIASLLARGALPYGGHPMASVDPTLVGNNDYDGLVGRTSQFNGLCRAAECRALDLAAMRFSFELFADALIAESAPAAKKEDDKEKEKDQGQTNQVDQAKGAAPKKEEKKGEDPKDLLDGVPEWFVGPLIADLVAHEVGHTLGLRHNFKASSIYSLEKINSAEIKGKKPFAGSVMDYLPVNIYQWEDREKQGDYGMIDIGPYDHWAIEYGYSLGDKPEDLKAILKRASEPELQFATDEDTMGPDPLARRYDFAADPLAYARRQMELAHHQRGRLLDKFVKDGQSWSRARQGYEMTLALQTRALSIMSGWLGGAFVNRDKKGDPGNRAPIEVIPVARQREALTFILETAFRDNAYGLNPELLRRMTIDKWLDDWVRAFEDPTWPVHDRIMGIQALVLTRLLNPGTLGRVYDNEFLVPAKEDAVTLPEVLRAVDSEIWSELDRNGGTFSDREPLISSLRRNLQREHVERLIDLSMPASWGQASHKPISTLALLQLRQLSERIGKTTESRKEANALDAYSRAHLTEAKLRIDKALDAGYVLNAGGLGGGGIQYLILGQTNAIPTAR